MPFVLTVNSQITCGHNAPVTLTSSAKLTVAGARALLLSNITGATIATCPNQSSNTKKCTFVATATGTAAKLTVAGQPVVNDTLTGTTDGTPAPVNLKLLNPGQTKLSSE